MSHFFRGGIGQVLQQAVPLGTGAVTTQTRAVGRVPQNARVKGIRFYGDAAVTGTTLTAEVFVRDAAGGAGVTLQSAATDVKFASQAAARAGVAASLTATTVNRENAKERLVEVVVTASAITAGPGDLVVAIEYDPIVKAG